MTFSIPRTCAGSDGFLNLSRLQARSAHSHTFHGAVDYCPNFLQIRKPSARRPVICVAHVVSCNRLFAAYFTYFCHNVQKFLSFTTLISHSKYAKLPFHAILFSKLFCKILQIPAVILLTASCYSASFSIFLFRATATFLHFQRIKVDIERFPSIVFNEN